ncbi:RNA polymerase sigma factor [Aestuariivivens sediminis]|uniref:RNA polymerase sigma factor n=1 Tax=Aestuariivivens sediminis TaxID=2913557 RepID=UPI001F59A0E7|nr:sigma-70 family RNA polymerase sigma factor [Aestuariivivens sediminis]
MDDSELYELRHNKNKLKEIYLTCKPKCFGFMIKCFGTGNLDDTKMLTIYNDAIIVLYEKIRDHEFILTSSVQVYLNSVCRNIALNVFKKEKKLFKTTDTDLENTDYDNEVTDILEETTPINPYENALQKAFNIIKDKGGNCVKILMMFWYQKASMQDIAYELGYSTPENAKNQKARCQKRLKDIALQLVEI